jgi:sugar-specific transcriptional regulator TrmB
LPDLQHIQSLVALGLNATEAEIYAELLQRSPVTGYGVAKALGKPAANVYKALETLEGKGAVVADDGGRKHYRAVPVEEFLGRLEREFDRHRDRAETALAGYPEPEDDPRIYQLRSREQVLSRCRQMLGAAEQIVLSDIFPLPARELRADFEKAAARGIQVVVKTYSPASSFEGTRVILDPEHDLVLDRWHVQWVNLYVDGSEFLVAVLDEGGKEVVQAIWSESPSLSWVFKSGFANELAFTEVRTAIREGATASALKRIVDDSSDYFALEAPGYQRMLKQLGRGWHIDQKER